MSLDASESPEATSAANSSPMHVPLVLSFEASLAPRDGDLLSLPFDQYGRMRIVQNIMNTLYEGVTTFKQENVAVETGQAGPQLDTTASELRVLDVGGYPGMLRNFLTPPQFYDLSILDVVPDNGSIPGYFQASGLDLPFDDASFDVVTALDTLEHIPNVDRERFLAETMRTSRHAVLLINPIQSIEADVAEETLDEYIRWLLDAQQEQLKEHREYGLPDFSATEDVFRRNGWRTHSFKVANVYNWLLMMIAKHYLLSLRDEKASSFERTLDRFYNLTFSDSDRSGPAYRGVILAVKPGLEDVLSRVETSYPPVPASDAANTERLGLTQVLMTLLDLKTANHEDRLLREQVEARDKHIAALEQRFAVQDVQLDHARHDLAQMDVLARNIAEMRQAQSDQELEHSQALNEKDKYIDELNKDLAAKNTHIGNLTSRLENEVRSKDEHILYLEKLLQGIESGRVLRLTRRVSRLLGK